MSECSPFCMRAKRGSYVRAVASGFERRNWQVVEVRSREHSCSDVDLIRGNIDSAHVHEASLCLEVMAVSMFPARTSCGNCGSTAKVAPFEYSSSMARW